MQTNAASYSATNSVYSAGAVSSGSSTQAQQAQALAGLGLDVMDAALAKLGRDLGLSPVQIDLGQAAMHAAFGDRAGATQNFREAASNYLDKQSPTDRSYLDRVLSEIEQNSTKLANQTREGADESTGAKRKAKNFFEAIALALGTLLGEKAANMMDSLKKMQTAGGSTSTGSPIDYTNMNDAQKIEHDDKKAQEARDFSVAQTEFSADSQTYNMVTNLVNNALKSIGEAMGTLSRK